jgi:dethiobiotin synthetase/adenosylmethionine--8-amino-7-oxononanoate aminotransferase
LAVTLTSQSIFEAFLSDNKAEALLHGHSYTAHAIGCEVANETLSLIDKLSVSEDWLAAQASWAKPDGQPSPVWSLWDPNFITAISKLPQVKEAMTLGSVLAIKVQGTSAGKTHPWLVVLVTFFSQSHHVTGYTSQSAQMLLQSLNIPSQDGQLSSAPGGAAFGIHFRTLGDVAYFMTSLNTTSTVIRSIEDRIWTALTGHGGNK